MDDVQNPYQSPQSVGAPALAPRPPTLIFGLVVLVVSAICFMMGSGLLVGGAIWMFGPDPNSSVLPILVGLILLFLTQFTFRLALREFRQRREFLAALSMELSTEHPHVH